MEKQIANIINIAMKAVSDNLDRNVMSTFSMNFVREECEKQGVFKNQQSALFWFSNNYQWVTKTIKQFNKIYKLPLK